MNKPGCRHPAPNGHPTGLAAAARQTPKHGIMMDSMQISTRLPVLLCTCLLCASAMLRGQPASAPDAKLPPDIDRQSYSRLPLIPRDTLDANGQRIYDFVNGGAGKPPRLGPPANSLYSIEVAEPYDHLNQLLRKTVAGPRYFEICTLIAAREYDQQYEWSAHELAARRVGVEQNIIDTIKFNRSLEGLPEKDAALIQFGRNLLHKHSIDSPEFHKMVELFGRQGLVELTLTIGDYAMTALLLNAVDQHLPPDRQPLLPIK
jgi:4-carboxymuconolactone decarboxylase